MNAERFAVTVSELNEYARRLLAGDPLLRDVEVTGEISGWKDHFSGHKYFALKDEKARVQCVMFRQDALTLTFRPADGMRVKLRASASIFERDGSFQLYVNEIRREGEGDLYLRFERLKRKLMAEGLFDPAGKRGIPFNPKIIGVATSRTGAVIRDIIRVAKRRNPNVGVLLAPCSVQGANAAEEIVEAIRKLNASGEPDVILVGRGGGSMEDLWPFNEEIVARAIAESRIPVISCVGHETDFTIADFVADLRAPTPSAAAEIAVPVRKEIEDRLQTLTVRMAGALSKGQQIRRAGLERLGSSAALSMPSKILIEPKRNSLDAKEMRMENAVRQCVEKRRSLLESRSAALRALNPAGVLDRGYALVEHGGRIIGNASDIERDEEIRIRMRDGSITARATEVSHG